MQLKRDTYTGRGTVNYQINIWRNFTKFGSNIYLALRPLLSFNCFNYFEEFNYFDHAILRYCEANPF